jgi:hypothetical protein
MAPKPSSEMTTNLDSGTIDTEFALNVSQTFFAAEFHFLSVKFEKLLSDGSGIMLVFGMVPLM